jgi:hypothetical protein
VAFIIGVLKAADDRRGGVDEPGKLRLRKTRGCSQPADFAGDIIVRTRFFQVFQARRLARIKSAVKDLYRVGNWFRSLR